MAKRRANGEGSIYKKVKTVNGKKYESWEAQLTIGYNADGKPKRKTISGKTQADVIAKVNELKHTITTGEYKEPSKMTLSAWFEIWHKEYLVDTKRRTKDEYKRHFDNHILPVLGKKQLSKITGADIQSLCNNLKNHRDNAPLSAKTIKDIHSVLHNCLDTALENDYIKRNPADHTKLPKVKQKEIKPLDEEQITAFLKQIQGHRYEELFITALFTGLRESELCGLTWDCVNFKTNELTVKQQLQKVDGVFQLVSTKTDNTDTISVAKSVMNILQGIRTEQLSNGISGKGNFVFTEKEGDKTGRYCIPHVVYENFKRVASNLGIPEARFHDLRHSCATALLANGVDIKTVQQTLRHKNAGTTQRYVHCTESMMKEGANKMDNLFKRVQSA